MPKVYTITTTSNAEVSSDNKPPTINGKVVGNGKASTSFAKFPKITEIVSNKNDDIFRNTGDKGPIIFDNNELDFDDCNISEVIMFLQKLARSPNASAMNMAFTKHITNALMQVREEKLKLETSIPRKLDDGHH